MAMNSSFHTQPIPLHVAIKGAINQGLDLMQKSVGSLRGLNKLEPYLLGAMTYILSASQALIHLRNYRIIVAST